MTFPYETLSYECLSELESGADTGKVSQGGGAIIVVSVSVDNGDGLRESIFAFVVVGDDGVDMFKV